ncbi:MAG: right-handed parallel beta-helix repeat-containing protein [Thermoflexibacter sp.]|jgi:parallel beta-helix repeat protein|nr:right-handed parallel beta-helix repeat-containing protein [Thermoflexibacter sp.]
MKTTHKSLLGLICFLLLWSISILPIFAQKDFQKRLQTKMILAKDGEVIDIEEGNFLLTASLSLDNKKNITIRGKGMDKTILSFKGQVEGAEGIKVTNAENIVIENLTVQDTKGDAIKTQSVAGISFKNVKTAWTGKPNKKNGGYGLYPVQCSKVLIDNCVAIGASDAGIYVGQSREIVVKNSKAYHNVAGIEIENSINADVFDNEAYHNTGGVLVFDLPDLIQKKGGNVRVFRNKIHDNNLPNFAPKGNIVAKVPDGTGILILATNNVEIFDNEIINNKSIGTGIISYYMTENPIKDDSYYPYPTGIYIHDNLYQREPVRPTSKGRMGQMFRFKLKFGKDVPHILYDGIIDPKTKNEKGELRDETRICIRNNKNQSFANIDAENDFKQISRDAMPYSCELKSLKVENK